MDKLKRKEDALRHWQSELSKREHKIEMSQDNICNLMSELRIKDSLLCEKDNIIGTKEREIDDIRRDVQNSVTEQVEVFCVLIFSVIIVCCCRILSNCTSVSWATTVMVGRCVCNKY